MPVIVAADFPPAIGGIQRYMERVAMGFVANGRPVVVVAPETNASGDDVRPYRVVRYARGSRAATLYAMERAIERAKRLACDRAIIASSWNPAGLVASLRHRTKRDTFAIMAFGSEIARQDSTARRFAMRSVFDRADVVISISQFTSQLLRDAGIERKTVLAGCGVDSGFFRPNPGRIPIILSVGRLVRRKGFDRVIASLPVLRQRFPSLRYEIVGDGPDREYLRALANRLGVGAHVVFHGSASDEATRAAYERAWCFALPVRRERHDVEGFGLVYLEAATASLAAVGGRESGAEDAIVHGETGLLVDGRRDYEVTEALDVLLRDRVFAARLSAAAYERAVREFTWDRVVSAISTGVGLA